MENLCNGSIPCRFLKGSLKPGPKTREKQPPQLAVIGQDSCQSEALKQRQFKPKYRLHGTTALEITTETHISRGGIRLCDLKIEHGIRWKL